MSVTIKVYRWSNLANTRRSRMAKEIAWATNMGEFGSWLIMGILSWSCTVPPLKDGFTYQHIRFSEWLESMRKDVECTFGILKGRFTVLRHGVHILSHGF